MRASPTEGSVWPNLAKRRHSVQHRLLEADRVTIVTLLEPELRSAIDAATDGSLGKVHVESPSQAAQAVREHSPTALLLSPTIASRYSAAQIGSLVARSIGTVPVAVLGADWPTAQRSLLVLGRCGVRQLVNLAQRDGWDQLRKLMHETAGDCRIVVFRQLLIAAKDSTDEFKAFLATLVRMAPGTATVRTLATGMGVEPSTLMSRFYRARLPAPKKYLVMTRLLYASWFLEEPRVSVAAASDALLYSSPQSFGRHLRSTLGLSTGQFRREMPLRLALEHYRSRLLEPYRQTLSWFRPLPPEFLARETERVDEGESEPRLQ